MFKKQRWICFFVDTFHLSLFLSFWLAILFLYLVFIGHKAGTSRDVSAPPHLELLPKQEEYRRHIDKPIPCSSSPSLHDDPSH